MATWQHVNMAIWQYGNMAKIRQTELSVDSTVGNAFEALMTSPGALFRFQDTTSLT